MASSARAREASYQTIARDKRRQLRQASHSQPPAAVVDGSTMHAHALSVNQCVGGQGRSETQMPGKDTVPGFAMCGLVNKHVATTSGGISKPKE